MRRFVINYLAEIIRLKAYGSYGRFVMHSIHTKLFQPDVSARFHSPSFGVATAVREEFLSFLLKVSIPLE